MSVFIKIIKFIIKITKLRFSIVIYLIIALIIFIILRRYTGKNSLFEHYERRDNFLSTIKSYIRYVERYKRHGIFPNELYIFNNSHDNIVITKENYIKQVRYVPYHILQARQSTGLIDVSPVVILMADVFIWPVNGAFAEFKPESFLNASLCPVHECYITNDWKNFNNTDVIVFHMYASDWNTWIPNHKEQNQIWVFSHIESPRNTHIEHDPQKMRIYQEKMNWSASYRRDSNFYVPYGLYISNELIFQWNISNWRFVSIYQNRQNIQKKLVTAMISNCNNQNKRMDLIQELRKYVLVDNLSSNLKCSTVTWKCPKFTDHCFKQLADNYKFFLAFENSNCQEYITEKLYLNALSYGFF